MCVCAACVCTLCEDNVSVDWGRSVNWGRGIGAVIEVFVSHDGHGRSANWGRGILAFAMCLLDLMTATATTN